MTTLRHVRALVAAASAAEPRMQVIYVATARAELAALRGELGALELSLDALEREIARTAPATQPSLTGLARADGGGSDQ